jgi:hypothetical protein
MQGVDAEHRSGDESGPPPPLLDRGRVPTGAATVVRHGLPYIGQLASIATAGSPIQPSMVKRRFTDSVFTNEPVYPRLMPYLGLFGRGGHRAGEALPAAAGTPEARGLVMRGR